MQMEITIGKYGNGSSNSKPAITLVWAIYSYHGKEAKKSYSYRHSDDAHLEFCYFPKHTFDILSQVLLFISALLYSS